MNSNIAKIEELLDKIRPHLLLDGGNINVVALSEDKVLTLKWTGSCAVCERSEITFKYSIREYLLKEFPLLKDVVEI